MTLNSFCNHHAQRLIRDEHEALRYWHEAVRRGESTFFDGQLQAAALFYRCALDVVRLRSVCRANAFFAEHHFTHPICALVDIYLEMEEENLAYQMVQLAHTELANSALQRSHSKERELQRLLERIPVGSQFMGESSSQGAKIMSH